MYKLIASDMDGTLLRSDRTISEETKEAIRNIKDKGAVFVLSTGRPLIAVEKYNELLNLNCPVILYNGAMIFDFSNRKVLFEVFLDFEYAKYIWDEGNKKKLEMYVWANNDLYTNFINDKVYDYIVESHAEIHKLDDIKDIKGKNITKIIWDEDPELLKRYIKELDEIKFNEKVNYCTSMSYYLEFFNKETSKKVAIQKLEEIYGIKREEVIAIGDGKNDMEMIKYAGLGVAMDNAIDEVKKVAKVVTKSNNEDGVLEIIKKFI